MIRNSLRAAPLALLLLAVSCGKSTVTVTQISPGAQCANGGVQIVVDDGTPQVVCNGTDGTNGSNGVDGGNGTNGSNGADGSNGFNSLVQTVTLPIGDPNCPEGGERIDTGLDNGSGGGIANDGILQPGEITSTSYVCNGSGEHIGSITPPGGSEAGATILAQGGETSDAGDGATGGAIEIYMANGTIGGHVKIFRTGLADPSFTMPSAPELNLGANPVTISADTQLASGPADDAGPGALFLDDNGTLSIEDVDGGAIAATSLTVSADATVSVVPSGEGSTATLQVQGPIINQGTLSLANAGVSITFQINANGYFGGASSHVINDTPAADGDIVNAANSGGITLTASPFWNQGSIEAKGGDGFDGGGGNGGTVVLNASKAQSTLYNTGNVDTSGGSGTVGGVGGNIQLDGYGDVNNSGALLSRGGDGTQQGGNGGSISLAAGDDETGSVQNGGSITATGGNVAASCAPDETVSCQAGSGANVSVETWNGAVVSSAPVSARGGDSPSGHGGTGASINFSIYGSDSALVPAGDLVLSGNLDSSGGMGALSGGGSGNVNISLDCYFQPNGQEIILYGYSTLDVSGSSGFNGGNGGSIRITNTYYSPSNECRTAECRAGATPQFTAGQSDGPGGSVINYADLASRGGGSSTGMSGQGGLITLSTQSNEFFGGDDFEQTLNAGNIDTSGGSGEGGAYSGPVTMYGLTGVSNSGDVTSHGGSSSSSNYPGGGANGLSLSSDNGLAVNLGALDFAGGDGPAQGGSASEVQLSGTTAVDSGQISNVGGAGTGEGGIGGAGGSINLLSSSGTSSVTVSAPAGLSVAGGAGTAQNGAGGEVTIDGWDVTSQWTSSRAR